MTRPMRRAASLTTVLFLLLILGACSGGAPSTPVAAPSPAVAAPVSEPIVTVASQRALPPALVPPETAFRRGWMPLGQTGVTDFARAHPTWDGRGVLIAILDSGIDPGIPGLGATSTGERKILDLRDFSGEGRIALTRLTPNGDTVTIAGRRLTGFSHVRAMDADGPWFGGYIAEDGLGDPAAADLNADGDVADTLLVVVTRASDGWVLYADRNGDGSLGDDRPIHDYLVARETFGWSPKGATPYISIAVNFSGSDAPPQLDLFFDNSAHGSHVAGIAAGHDMYGVKGFDGVAPGAQLLGLKIADDAQGGISRTGSMVQALDYAIRFAQARQMPLVVNLSFGVGNEEEGAAKIDHLFDSTLALHPDVVLTVAAGNDGPGLSTLGFPGSAFRVMSIGALFPGVFLSGDDSGAPPPDGIADFSGRGGEVAGPDLVTPGVAYSTVPLWDRGGEREGGTSMASPHAAGLAARLVSAAAQERLPYSAWTIRQALMVTAQPVAGATFVDDGTGVPSLPRAWAWLQAKKAVPLITVQGDHGASGVFIDGTKPRSPKFTIQQASGAGSVALRFRTSADWLEAPQPLTLGTAATPIELKLKSAALQRPGTYVGVVSGWGPDTLAGPLVRLVTTVVVPYRDPEVDLRDLRIPAAQWVRVPFSTDSARPFTVRVTSATASSPLSYLHEPAGMPYRDNASRPVGEGENAATYDVLGRDALAGTYELVIQASPFEAATASVEIRQAPVRFAIGGNASVVEATVSNLSGDGVRAELGAALVGVGKTVVVKGSGSGRVDLPLEAPAWARAIQVDLDMPRADWARYTDLGFTLFDSAGRQLVKSPVNYAFGRLEHEIERSGGPQRLTLALFPGFALPEDAAAWSVTLRVRFYVDSAQALAPMEERALSLGPGETRSMRFTLSGNKRPVPAGYAPVALVLVRTGDEEIWANEATVGMP